MTKSLDLKAKEAALTISVRHLLRLKASSEKKTAQRILDLYGDVYTTPENEKSELLPPLMELMEHSDETAIEHWLLLQFTK